MFRKSKNNLKLLEVNFRKFLLLLGGGLVCRAGARRWVFTRSLQSDDLWPSQVAVCALAPRGAS